MAIINVIPSKKYSELETWHGNGQIQNVEFWCPHYNTEYNVGSIRDTGGANVGSCRSSQGHFKL